MINRRRVPVVFGVSLSLLIGAGVAVGSEPGAFDRTLKVTGPIQLDVRSDPGGVAIRTGPAAAIRIRASIKPLYGRMDFELAEANIRALEQHPPIEQTGETVRIGYVQDPALLRGVTIHFEIEVPQATRARVYTESGGIRVDGIRGPAELRTASGRTEVFDVASEIRVQSQSGAVVVRDAGSSVFVRARSGGVEFVNIQGPVDVETTSGKTEITDVLGEVRSTTHSGSIVIRGAKAGVTARNHSGRIDALQLGGSVHAETKSGAIRISQLNPAPIRAVAESGAIAVTLASGGGYLLDARSHSGKVSAPATLAAGRPAGAHSLSAQLGHGGPLVDLDTRSSRIEIDQGR